MSPLSKKLTKLGKTVAATGALLIGCLGVGPEARATLGGNVASIDENQAHLGGARRVETLATGERHVIELPSGIVLHEYVSPSGAVYAIAWRGPRMPDLRELLGAYFTQLSDRTGRAPGGSHHRMNLTGTDLVVQSSGHRGSFAGRAWVPSLVPSGVEIDASLD
jgi:Protein of unknown function (DUF2844)